MELHFWGANSHLQSGSGTPDEQFETPIVINFPNPETITNIYGGGGHTIIITNDGKAFAAGWNNKGQLGISGTKDSPTFVPIQIDIPIRTVRCGWDITALVSVTNDFLVFGNNQYYQFGTKEPKFTDSALKINLPEGVEVSDVTFGLRHTSILSKSGKIFLFGQSRCLKVAEEMRHPQLKTRKFQHNNVSYLELNFTSPISLITSGQYSTLAYIGTENRLFLIGENKHVSLSNQDIDVSSVSMIREISAGWTHFAFLDGSGVVHTFGRNNYHQLGRESGSESTEGVVAIQDKVNRVCCGSEHTAVLTEFGKVLTWGWNEHGNCGVNGIENVAEPTEVKLPGKCLMIATNCGFCFALTKR